jgi:hypothetical protein
VKEISDPIWRSSLLWLVLVGSFVSILAGMISSGNYLIQAVSIFGGLLSAIGGVLSTVHAHPKVFCFSESDWKKVEDGNAILTIAASIHKKGRWPTYKTLTGEGECFLCTQYIRECGDIELVAPQQSIIGLNGRIHVK